LSRGFLVVFCEEFLFYLHRVMRSREVVFFLPLTIIIIADSAENTSGNVAQNYGKNFVQSASHFLLDKLCEMWYNEKLGASRALAPRPKNRRKIKKQEGQPLFAFKIS